MVLVYRQHICKTLVHSADQHFGFYYSASRALGRQSGLVYGHRTGPLDVEGLRLGTGRSTCLLPDHNFPVFIFLLSLFISSFLTKIWLLIEKTSRSESFIYKTAQVFVVF